MEYQIEQDPLISVVLPVRNNQDFLQESLESLIAQNYKNIEIIAIDDFSTDNSLQILNTCKSKDNRIKIYQNVKKYGLATTLNRAIKRSKGKFIVFMDPLDTVTANKIFKQFEFLKKNPKVTAVGTQCIYLNSEGKRIGKSSFPENNEQILKSPLHGIAVLMEGVMINRYKIPKDLLYFPTKRHLLLYTDLALRLMQYGELANIGEYLLFHRKKNNIKSLGKHFLSLSKLWFSSKLQTGISLPFRSLLSNLRPTAQ